MLERPKNLRNNLQIVDLESLVPKNHLLRKIDAAIDFVNGHLRIPIFGHEISSRWIVIRLGSSSKYPQCAIAS
jgi:hypothetical protein